MKRSFRGQLGRVIRFIHHINRRDQHAARTDTRFQRRDHGLGVVARHDTLSALHQSGVSVSQVDALLSAAVREVVHGPPDLLSENILVGQLSWQIDGSVVLSSFVLGFKLSAIASFNRPSNARNSSAS